MDQVRLGKQIACMKEIKNVEDCILLFVPNKGADPMAKLARAADADFSAVVLADFPIRIVIHHLVPVDIGVPQLVTVALPSFPGAVHERIGTCHSIFPIAPCCTGRYHHSFWFTSYKHTVLSGGEFAVIKWQFFWLKSCAADRIKPPGLSEQPAYMFIVIYLLHFVVSPEKIRHI